MKKSIILLISILLGQNLWSQDINTLTKKGSEVPQFSFESSPGVVKSITGYKGKVVLITFFATWCGPCRQELPHIEKEIYQKYANNNSFALLVFGREHDWATVNKFRADQQFTMPLYPDPGRNIYKLFAGQNIPRNFLVNREGKIIYASTGYDEHEFGKLKKEIEKALTGKR